MLLFLDIATKQICRSIFCIFICITPISISILLSQQDSDDDVDEDNESHLGYMHRGVPSESESTSMRSASICEVANNSGGCSIEDTPMDSKENSLSLAHRVKGYSQAASLDSVMTISYDNSNTSKAKEEKILGGQMKKEEKDEEEEGYSGNVNLWSVVLKSLQPEEEEANKLSETRVPFLPLSQNLQEDSLTASVLQTECSSELHTALLYHTRTESVTGQEEENVYGTNVCDHLRTGYMASHTGTLDTENYSSEDEEEDNSSSYMTR